ncbi:MAG: GAF domain-containing protein, partial [Planctomycetes bacterium]|nr:GAF domain-containing protein [Planctomycetota bacterium]
MIDEAARGSGPATTRRLQHFQDSCTEVGSILAQAESLEAAAAPLLSAVARGLDAAAGEFWAWDAAADALRCTACWHGAHDPLAVLPDGPCPPCRSTGDGLARSVWDSLRAQWLPDLAAEPACVDAAAARAAGLRSACASPIRVGAARFGVLLFFSADPTPPDGEILRQLGVIAGSIAQFASRRRSEAQLRASEARLQKIEAAARLAGWVAHDFGNVLSTILALSYQARREVEGSSPAAARIAEIEKAAQRGATLVAKLLSFGRQAPTQPRPVDLNRVIADLAGVLPSICGQKVTLLLACAPGPLLVLADPGQLEQVLLNLVMNARDAMHGGGRLRITTGRARPESAAPPGPPRGSA